MSEVLEKVREKYPQYKDVAEDDLALRIGSKFPAYLDSDPEFKNEFQGAVAARAVDLAKAGTSDLLKVLTNPAAGEAAQQGREDIAFQKSIGDEPKPPRSGEELAAQNVQALKGTQFDPLREREKEIRPQTLTERVESGLQNAPVVGKLFTATKLPYEIEKERGIPEKQNVANAVRDLLGGVIKPESIALLSTGAGEAEIAKLSPKLATAVRQVVSGYFAMQGVEGVAQNLPEALKPGKTLAERAGSLVAAAGSGAIAAGAGYGLLKEAAKVAEPVAPMTAAAVAEQPGILETAKKAQEPPQMPQERLEAPKTRPEAEKPTGTPKAEEAGPSWQITGASYTNPETGESAVGKNHIEAAKAQGVEAPKKPQDRHTQEYGYEVQNPQTGETRYVTRDEGLEIARKSGQLLNEPTLDKLHSNEIWHAIPFEKRQKLKQVGLSDQDISDLESGKANVEEIVARKLPSQDRGPDHAAALEEARIQAYGDIEQILQEERKPNASKVSPTTEVYGDVRSQQESASELPKQEGGGGVQPQAEGGIPEAQKPEAPKEPNVEAPPKRVAQALSSTKRFHKETELNGPDILSWMADNMKMLSKSAARLKWGRPKFRQNQSLWDDAKPLERAHHNIVFSDKGETPDKVAQAAYEAGILKEPSVNELHAAMQQASKARSKVFETAAREEKFIKEEAKQHTDWLKATKEGERRISGDHLKVGDMLEVEGEQIEVTAVDPETGEATLKDGRKFGTQTLGEGQTIHVEKWEPSPEEEASFGPEEAAPEAEPIKPKGEKPATPKLGAMEKGTGDLLKGVEEPFALSGEKGTDADRIAAEKAAAEKRVSEAKALEDKQQLHLEDRKKPVISDTLKKALSITTNQQEAQLGRAAPIKQASLSELTNGKPLFHETSLEHSYGVYAGLRRSFKQSWTRFLASDNPDLALGQSGSGVLFEIDPSRVNGWKHFKPGTSNQTGFEYNIDRSVWGAINAVTFKTKRQLEAFKKRFPNYLNFENAQETERGLRVSVKGSTPKSVPESSPTEAKVLKDRLQQPLPIAQEQAKISIPEGKFRLKGQGPQTYTVTERLPATEIEIANGEQPIRVKNERTGEESVVLESQLQEVKARSTEEKAASKGMSRKELDDELRRVGLDPSSFSNMREKKEALRREKLKGPGSPSLYQGPDPKPQIQQLEESFRGIKGEKVPFTERLKAAFDLGEKLAAGKDVVSKAIAGFKTAGDLVIQTWKGDNTLDDLLRAKGDLSAAIETRGWTTRQFAKRVRKAIPDIKVRAAIAKWIDAGGQTGELLWGANHTKPEYRQAYIDAMHLSGDNLVAAQNLKNYFDARLQEAIDAGVLEHGIEDYIHRIFERDPDVANKITGFVQSGILSKNPALAKKRIFQMDWEAERLGYRVVQDFIPRVTHYETSLSRAIAARDFIKNVIGYTDKNGNKIKGMTAPDGRPIIDVAGLGTPIEDQVSGVREGTLINPSFKPRVTKNPLNERGDYQERPEYSALRKWKWVIEDEAGKPIYVQGNVVIHPEFVGRIDDLLKPSSIRYAKKPITRGALRTALGVSSAVKQTMLDFSGFHQVQIAVHAAEHRVMPWNVIKDIDFENKDVQGLMKGGTTLGGEYYESSMREGLAGRSLSRLIPGISSLMETYHNYLFQDFIPRVKMSMALHALERNRKRYGKTMPEDEIFALTSRQANAAFGGLNYTMLERSRTAQDLSRLILLAPDFLEARVRFTAQAFTKHGAEQRQALLLGALVMYTTARIANQLINGQPHMEPENAFSIIYNGKSYGLRTVQGDILHLVEQPFQFWMSRLNPVFGRTMLELGTGRDYFGRKRSVPEQMWDAVSTMTPVSLRSSRERALWESLLNGMGVTARRYADTDQAFKLAQKWKDKNKIGARGEFIYDSDKDPLRPLKLALSNGDDGGAAKEIKNLLDSKTYTVGKLNDYFNRYSNMPFTGSRENDRKFEASLSEDEKKTVQAAKEHKKAIRALYLKALGQLRAAQSEPPPEEADAR